MRKEFLRNVAERFYEFTGGELRNYCFVFPNRRSSLFFRRYLGEIADRPVFSPHITSISDLFISLSGLHSLDRITLLHRLYTVFQEKVEGCNESFDDFVYRGEVLLGDFDDIDKYLVDARGLFANIRDLKEIEDRYEYLSPAQREAIASFWGVVIPFRDGNKEARFLRMWNSMYDIYNAFRDRLDAAGEAYEGMIYRKVAEALMNPDMNPDMQEALCRWHKTVFVGLNAPNRCERQLFDVLLGLGRADFYWDYYGDAVRDPANKSSLLMEGNVRRYPSEHPLPEDGGLCDVPPEITAVQVPSAVGQAKYVHRILRGIASEEGTADLFSTAVLLPDEQLLFPLLNSLPEEISPVNVTMGYSLAHSSVSSFISALALMQDRIRVRDGAVLFYFRDVLSVLNHPYISVQLPDGAKELKERICKENIIYVEYELLPVDAVPALAAIFRKAEQEGEPVPYSISEYLRTVLMSVAGKAGRIDKEFLMGYCKSLNLLQALPINMRRDTYFRLLHRLEASVSIPFSGEPLDGLQIMGPLEIRALDFENLVILSVNEGVFPSRNTPPSMIPYNLRRGFGLPTYELQDSISAYHFYRSICRARRVWLLSDNRGDGLRSGEESRYIKQLEYHFHYPVHRHKVTFDITGGGFPEVEPVAKTPEHIEYLGQMTFSNSSLQSWLSCPMQFYYRYVLHLKEEEDLSEGVDNAAFGTLYHYVMRCLYEPFIGKVLDAGALGRISADTGLIRSSVQRGFYEELMIREVSGRNRIAGALAEKIAARTVGVDAGMAPLTVKELEKSLTACFETSSGRKVRINGIFDRVDIVDGKLRIVDYKTGSGHFTCKDMGDLFDPEKYHAGSHIFQLYLYLLIMDLLSDKPIEDVSDVLLEIYYTKNLYKGVRSVIVPQKEDYDAFRKGLSALLDRILDPGVPFTADGDERTCSHCPFSSYCNR